jgi:hypothetical protein
VNYVQRFLFFACLGLSCLNTAWCQSGLLTEPLPFDVRAKAPALKPFGELDWDDGLAAVVHKLQKIETLMHLDCWLDEKSGSMKEAKTDQDIASVLHSLLQQPRFSHAYLGGVSQLQITRERSQPFVNFDAVIKAGPIFIDDVPFEIVCVLTPHPAIAILQPDKTIIDTDSKTAFPVILSKVSIVSESAQLPEHIQNIDETLISKYGDSYCDRYQRTPIGAAKERARAQFRKDLAQGYAIIFPGDRLGNIEIDARARNFSIKYSIDARNKWFDNVYRQHLAKLEAETSKPKQDLKSDL